MGSSYLRSRSGIKTSLCRIWGRLRGGFRRSFSHCLLTGGYLYTTGPGGLQVFASDATCLGTIYVPQGVTNFTWGDDDLCSLYINAGTSLYRTRVKVPGRKLF